MDQSELREDNNGIYSDFDHGLFEVEPKEDIGIEVELKFNLTPTYFFLL